jgi:hypothetical protein
MNIYPYKTKQDYKPLKMSQYVLSRHTNLSIKNQNVFCPKRNLKKTNSTTNNDDTNHKQSSMTRNTNNNNNLNALSNNNKITSNTVYKYVNKKNRHVSLDAKSKNESNNNNNITSLLYKKINEFTYFPIKEMNNVLNGKKNSMSKNKRAMEYSLKVKKINMNNSALAAAKSHSKNREQSSKKRTTSNDRPVNKTNSNKNMYINDEIGDAFINHGLNLINVQKNKRKSRNINQENASIGSCSTDRSKTNNNYKHGLTMNYMKKTFSNGYTVKTYRDKDITNELKKYNKINNNYRNNIGNKSGTINNKKLNGNNVCYNKEKVNYTQMYLRKNVFREQENENVKNNLPLNRMKQH